MPTIIPQPTRDVFPTGDNAFLDWAQNFDAQGGASPNTYITAAPVVFGIELSTFVVAYETALTSATNPATRTSVSIAEKNAAKATLLSKCRENTTYLKAGLKSGLVSDAEYTDLGLRLDKSRSPIPAPDVAPVVAITELGVGFARVEARDPASPDRRRLPDGSVGVQTMLIYGDGSVTEMAPFSSRSGFQLASDPSRVGSMASIKCRFQNAKGETGPWSTAVSFVVT